LRSAEASKKLIGRKPRVFVGCVTMRRRFGAVSVPERVKRLAEHRQSAVDWRNSMATGSSRGELPHSVERRQRFEQFFVGRCFVQRPDAL
jgi:hypothetical protein